jgi:hypothetical protein
MPTIAIAFYMILIRANSSLGRNSYDEHPPAKDYSGQGRQAPLPLEIHITQLKEQTSHAKDTEMMLLERSL